MSTPSQTSQLRALLLGGILPIVAFTVIEEVYGTIAGLVAGMVFGVGEIAYEWIKEKKVSAMTLGGNLMLLVLGGVSLITNEGIWFKLQPALIEGAMAGFFLISVWLRKSVLFLMIEKQGALARFPEAVRESMSVLFKQAFKLMTLRIAAFLAIHAVATVWVALKYSTAVWAAFKGIGFTVTFLVYVLAEGIWLRKLVKAEVSKKTSM